MKKREAFRFFVLMILLASSFAIFSFGVIAPGTDTAVYDKVYLVKADDYTSEEYNYLMQTLAVWIKNEFGLGNALVHDSAVSKEYMKDKLAVFYYDKRFLIVVGDSASESLKSRVEAIEDYIATKEGATICGTVTSGNMVDDVLKNSLLSCGGAARINSADLPKTETSAYVRISPEVIYDSTESVKIYFKNKLGSPASMVQILIRDYESGKDVYGSGPIVINVSSGEEKEVFEWNIKYNVAEMGEGRVKMAKYIIVVRYAIGNETTAREVSSHFYVKGSETVCKDSDGKNFFERGKVIVGEAVSEDSCETEVKVKEFYCSDSGSGSKIYECPNGCSEGACVKIKPEKKPVEIPDKEDKESGEKIEKKDLCDGCVLDNRCAPVGYRTSGNYCHINGTFLPQILNDGPCDNNFECESNLCAGGNCVSKGLLTKIMDWIKSWFG